MYHSLGDYAKVIEYHTQRLAIANEVAGARQPGGGREAFLLGDRVAIWGVREPRPLQTRISGLM